jgi:hypothetical protein
MNEVACALDLDGCACVRACRCGCPRRARPSPPLPSPRLPACLGGGGGHRGRAIQARTHARSVLAIMRRACVRDPSGSGRRGLGGWLALAGGRAAGVVSASGRAGGRAGGGVWCGFGAVPGRAPPVPARVPPGPSMPPSQLRCAAAGVEPNPTRPTQAGN